MNDKMLFAMSSMDFKYLCWEKKRYYVKFQRIICNKKNVMSIKLQWNELCIHAFLYIEKKKKNKQKDLRMLDFI